MKKNMLMTLMAALLGLFLQLTALAQPASTKAWVWVDSPTAATSTPLPGYQFNPSGALNRVVRLAQGSYRVDFPNLGVLGGTAQVTAYGGSHFCTVEGWGPTGTTQQVFVRCFTPLGSPMDGKFTLLFYKEQRSFPYESAYLWAGEEFTPNYTPNPAYQWNSNGGTNTVRRLSTGQYDVFLPGVNTLTDNAGNGGHVQVSGYGTTPYHAVVQNWYSGFNGTTVRVNTLDVNGNFIDTKFTLSFMTDVAPGARIAEDPLNMYGTFLWADQPMAVGYTPDTHYRFTNAGGEAAIERVSVGNYRVKLPNLKAFNKTTALVSAYGRNLGYCSVSGWGQSPDGGTKVEVQCRSASGQLIDGRFTLLYLTNDTILW